MKHPALVHRVGEEDASPVARFHEVDEIHVPTRMIVGHSRRGALTAPTTAIAGFNLNRRIPARSPILRALHPQKYAAVGAHGPPRPEQLTAVRCHSNRHDAPLN